MESLALAIYLFLAIFAFFAWLTTPMKINKVESNAEKRSVEKEIISVEKSIIVGKINDSKSTELLEEELKYVPVNYVPNINERSEMSFTGQDDKKSLIDIAKLKTYKLHGNTCVKIMDLPEEIQLPQHIKRYKLRNQIVVKLSQLEPYLI